MESLPKFSEMSVEQAKPEKKTPNHPITIAIADDHAVFKQGIQEVLRYSSDLKIIIEADNGATLLQLIKNNQPDVILLDLRMPVMDGLSTLRELKIHYPAIKVIILTMNSDSSNVQEAISMGVDGYLLKSSDPEIICQTIRKCFLPSVVNPLSTGS